MADKAASILAKLKNKAKASGISYQQCLQLFVQEEFLRKLSKSGYDNFLILKGGLFIYTLTNFESRATIDVDFLLAGYENSIDTVKDLICKIIDTPTGNDYITMTAQCLEFLTKQLSAEQGVTEELKEKSPMQWVQRMNNIRSQAEEVIMTELIYK